MTDFFATMYELFRSFYGQDLADHLYGLNINDTGAFDSASQYLSVGLTMVISSIFLALLYYKIVDSPRYSRWYHWLIVLAIAVIFNLFIGFYLPYLSWDTGKMATAVKNAIGTGNLWGFGFANAVLSLFWFFAASLIFKQRWVSTNCSTSPF